MQNLTKFHQFIHKILSGNEILTVIKGHNFVVNLDIEHRKIDVYQTKPRSDQDLCTCKI